MGGGIGIAKTTKEQRQKLVNGALGLGSLSGLPPSEESRELFQLYIDGKLELSEIKEMVFKKLSKKSIKKEMTFSLFVKICLRF